MNNEIDTLITRSKKLNIRIDKHMLSLYENGSMNGGQELYFIRKLKSGMDHKQPKPGLLSAEKALIERAKALGVDTGPYSQLLKPGSIPSSLQIRLKRLLETAIAKIENRQRREVEIKWMTLGNTEAKQ